MVLFFFLHFFLSSSFISFSFSHSSLHSFLLIIFMSSLGVSLRFLILVTSLITVTFFFFSHFRSFLLVLKFSTGNNVSLLSFLLPSFTLNTILSKFVP